MKAIQYLIKKLNISNTLIVLIVGLILSQFTLMTHAHSATSLKEAFHKQLSNVQVKGNGTVIRILADDLQGSKHQKFILQVSSEHSILIAHNIDLASRINSIANGDNVQFYGEYEWTKKGGVVHWTHHDPNKRHLDGWLKHKGQIYQ